MKFFPFDEITALRLTGTDRIDFLHGQVSNNVKNLPIPGSNRALILNNRGQIEFDLYVHRRENDLYIQTEAGLAAKLVEHLTKYIIFDDVAIEDISQRLAMFHIIGYDFLKQLGYLEKTQLIDSDFGVLLVSQANRLEQDGFDIHLLAENRDSFAEFLAKHGKCISKKEFSVERILNKRVNAHLDNFAGLLPQECGLDEAVSYSKGCYIGQEIMARLEARGHTNHELVLITADQPFTSGFLHSNKKEVGSIGQVVEKDGFFALASVRKDCDELFSGDIRVRKL